MHIKRDAKHVVITIGESLLIIRADSCVEQALFEEKNLCRKDELCVMLMDIEKFSFEEISEREDVKLKFKNEKTLFKH